MSEKRKQRKPTKREIAASRRYLQAHYTEIALHTLYLRWGLPTSLLRKPA